MAGFFYFYSMKWPKGFAGRQLFYLTIAVIIIIVFAIMELALKLF